MRALVVTPTLPPLSGQDVNGIYQRLGLFMGALAQFAPAIDIAHLVSPATIAAHPDAAALDRQQSAYWGHPVRVSLIPRRSRVETFASHYAQGVLASSRQPANFPFSGPAQAAAIGAKLDEQPDIVFVHRLEAMYPVRQSGRKVPRMVFDLDDVPHRVRLRASLQRPIWPGKLAYISHVPALIAAERQAMAAARLATVCSETDQQHLLKWGIARDAAVVPNAVALPPDPPGPAAEPTLMFLGSYEYGPNSEAAERLATRILPLVRRALPAARLLIAGKASDSLPSRRSAAEGVEYLGFVDDLAALYARSRVICCPIMNGGGTRLKLIEAAAYARPMVATTIGAEGLDFIDGEHILLRDSDADIAAACLRLLRDDALCQQLGAAARARMQALYEAGAIRERIAGLIRERVLGA
jgi:glycosyltransferase involved in cell wall biosynthesis